jgi:hypothetical protein
MVAGPPERMNASGEQKCPGTPGADRGARRVAPRPDRLWQSTIFHKEMDTMMTRIVALALAFALFAGVAVTAEAEKLTSGPQVGEELGGPFHPLNVTGAKAGEKHCLYCENGSNPVAMIFAREPNATLTKLIKKLDGACVKNKSAKMGSFVVFCSDDKGLETKLKKLAKDSDLKKVVLAIDNPAGPEKYNVSKDADVTVVLYTDRKCKANFAFKKGQMKDKDIETICAAVPKILSD